MPWQLAFEKGIRKGLNQTNREHKLYFEYLDAGRFIDNSYLQFAFERYKALRLDRADNFNTWLL